MKLRIIITLIFLIFINWQGFSDGNNDISEEANQKPSITGQVIDKETGEELVCANVLIEGQNFKTCTDIEGKFCFNSLPPGNYTLKIDYISYQESVIKEIRVRKNKPASLKIKLEPISFQ